MIILNDSPVVDMKEFEKRYRDEWRDGYISENSLKDLFDLIDGTGIKDTISLSIRNNMDTIIGLLLKYKYKKMQSVEWIEAIRVNNWALYNWINTDPEAEEYAYNKDIIKSSIRIALHYVFGKGYKERVSKEEIQELEEEFTLKNLANIDYIEDFLQKYAKSDKTRRSIQIA